MKLLFRMPTDKYIHDLQRNLNNTIQRKSINLNQFVGSHPLVGGAYVHT